MGNKSEYRILEHQGLFYVQIKVESKVDIFDSYFRMLGPVVLFALPYIIWLAYKHRNDKIIDWHNITAFGTQPLYGPVFNIPSIGGFKTLDEAKSKIILLTTPDKIHYLND